MRVAFERTFSVAVICGLFVLVGFASYASFGYGKDILKAYVFSGSWQRTAGTISASNAVQGCGRGGRGYYLKVVYTYIANEIKYTSDRVWLGNDYCSGKFGAESMAAQYLIGSTTFVYFNPAAPGESVLVNETVENGTVFLFLLLAAVPLGAVILVFKAFSQAKRQARNSPSLEQVLFRRAQLDRSIRVEIQERKRGG